MIEIDNLDAGINGKPTLAYALGGRPGYEMPADSPHPNPSPEGEGLEKVEARKSRGISLEGSVG